MLLLKPIKIYGTWDEGIVIDYHMLKSKFLGYDENGKEVSLDAMVDVTVTLNYTGEDGTVNTMPWRIAL